MKKTICTILTGLSLIPSMANSRIPDPKMDPLVVKIVGLLKTDHSTIVYSQKNERTADFSRCTAYDDGSISCPYESGTLIFYSQNFREGDKTIVIDYTDNQNLNDPTFQSDGIIGPADSLTIKVTFDIVRGKQRSNYFFIDRGLDRKLDGESDSFYGDMLELGVSSKEAVNYYDEKRTEIDQKYTDLLKEMEKRLTKKKK